MLQTQGEVFQRWVPELAALPEPEYIVNILPFARLVDGIVHRLFFVPALFNRGHRRDSPVFGKAIGQDTFGTGAAEFIEVREFLVVPSVAAVEGKAPHETAALRIGSQKSRASSRASVASAYTFSSSWWRV